jgi:SH3 domain protein
MKRTRVVASFGAGLALVLISLAAPHVAQAERAWLKGEVRLNVRTGAGTNYRIIGMVKTGDAVTVLSRDQDWTQIRTEDGKAGWIPAGYLAAEPPPTVRLAQLESEVSSLRERLESTSSEAEDLREKSETFSQRDREQQAQIRSLTEENLDLKAGARWPYLITGASILTVGMILGAVLSRTSGRRPQARLRL